MKLVTVALGTRPEVIKLAPVIAALRRRSDIEVTILVTGQHRDMVDSAMSAFNLSADHDLFVMTERQRLPELSALVIQRSAEFIRMAQPDYVVVHGDTMSAFCVGLAAFLERVRFAHVEAGLRSGSLDEPFPEEASRRLIDVIADLALAPTPLAARNLRGGSEDASRIVVTGQTAVDAIRSMANRGTLAERWRGRTLVTVTLHRRENWPVLDQLGAAIRTFALRRPDLLFVWPLHLNPRVREALIPVLSNVDNIDLIDPLDYSQMAPLLASSRLIVTDSGGLVEEGVSLGVPVAIVRNVTERPEGIDAGLAFLVGADPERIGDRLDQLAARPITDAGPNPYGDGRASERVAEAIAWRLGLARRPSDWQG